MASADDDDDDDDDEEDDNDDEDEEDDGDRDNADVADCNAAVESVPPTSTNVATALYVFVVVNDDCVVCMVGY
jgi:hypothetical protein